MYCQSLDSSMCGVKDMIYFSEVMCKAISEGRYKTRKELLDSTGSFFKRSESEALLATGLELVCPQYRDSFR